MQRIQPRDSYEGEFTLPGDKSITHRAVMLNASINGEAVVTDALIGEDCLSTCACLRALGARIDGDGTTLRIRGVQEFLQDTQLNCGNSGTTMRLLTGLLAGKGVRATLYGDSSLSSRPMKRVSEPLAFLGAEIETTDGHAPLYIRKRELYGKDITISVSSAQVKSALLLAGLFAEGETSVTEPTKSRDHTERMLAAMGADIQVTDTTTRIKRSALRSVNVQVPSDISSAAYFMALGALKGKTLCKNVGINPTRTGILRAFDKLGVKYSLLNKRVFSGEERADILVEKSPMRAIELTEKEIPSMVDELPLVALLCAFAEGESKITGAKELRVKECDRIHATTELINRLGGDCQELSDGFTIKGRKKLLGGDCNSYLDHRIAMTAAVGLIASEKGGSIADPDCVNISFPNFFKMLENGF